MYDVYVYFEDLPGIFAGERELLELCRLSWRKWGWNFNVLTRKDAERHPAFEAVKNNKYLILGAQHKSEADWERCSYYRWLALAMVNEGGLLIDYDMINYNFIPADFEYDFDHFDETTGRRYHGRDQFTFDAPKGLCPPTPCLIGKFTLQDIIELMATYQGEPIWDRRCYHINQKCTDQLLLHYHGTHVGPLFWDDEPWCHMYGSTGWHRAPVVHYTHWSIAQGYTANRADFIQLEKPV